MSEPLTVMFGPKPCRQCGRDHYKGPCPEPPPAPPVTFYAREIEQVYVNLGRFVAARRKALRLNQQDVADAMGLSRTSVTNIEAGRQRVLLHDALALAVILGAQDAVQPLYDAIRGGQEP